jgi:hypothetical protein
MSTTEVAETLAKLQALSPERAGKVLSLIEDLAELEVLENAEDLKDAREALAEMQAAEIGPSPQVAKPEFARDGTPSSSEPGIPYEQLRRELGLDR